MTAFVTTIGARIFAPRHRAISSCRFHRAPVFATTAFLFASTFVTRVGATDIKRAAGAQKCPAPTMAASLRDLKDIKAINGSVIPDTAFEGKVVLAVNVASACGYTASGYDVMKKVASIEKDVAVVAIPCNSFGMQENGTPDEIEAFGSARVPGLIMTERSPVSGADAHPIIKLGMSKFGDKIGWNFDGIFVFDKDGVPAARFGKGDLGNGGKAVIEAVKELL